MPELYYLAVISMATLIGNTIAVVVSAVLNNFYARQAVRAAARASDYAEITNKVVEATHKIVNNQRTQMLRMVASLAARIAKENPRDDIARIMAEQAELDAQRASDME